MKKKTHTRAVENRRTYRTVGQKLTRSDLNFSVSDPMSGAISLKSRRVKKNYCQKKNRNFRKIDARPPGIGYTFSSQTLQCEVKIWYIDENKKKSEIANKLFRGSVGERGSKLNFNLGLGCQSSNWFYPDLMLLTFE
jgi:hypothetical protein